MISVSNLSMAYGERTLFREATFQLNPGERYGLVGANGSGKTTLLSILSGDTDPTSGTVSMPKRIRLGVLRQDQFLYETESVLSMALMGNRELWEAITEKEEILRGAEEEFDADRFSALEEIVQLHDGYAAEARAASVLEGLGIPAELHHDPVHTLSGGFKLRVLLAQVLAGAPDALLLDEPTNHLDILSIRWLETFLADFAGPVVVISHDQRFLDNISTHILDVDYETVTLYHGNYAQFSRAKVEERERREKDIENREKEIAHHQKFVDRFRAKASKARQAQNKARLIERKAEEIVELPATSRRYPTFRFEQRRPSGRDVVTAKGIRKSFDDLEVLHGVDLEVHRGDRLAIIGPNGIGKSTFLKVLMGVLEPDAGTVEWGYETHPGYFAQDHADQFESRSESVQDWLWATCPDKDLGFVRGQLGLMLFSGDDPKKRVESLSGGESARLVFTRLSMERPNVLVLDEPTNHLDLESIEALVKGLEQFDGTIILVSHDRWFVSRLATRIVEIDRNGITDYRGSYDEYVASLGDDHLDVDQVVAKARSKRKARREEERNTAAESEAPPTPSTPVHETSRQGGLGRTQRRRLEEEAKELTARIERAEGRIREIDELFCHPGYFERTPPDELRKLEEERSTLQVEVDELLPQWEDLERKLL